eukprot:5230734-Pyramimonas_sp.AAC.1
MGWWGCTKRLEFPTRHVAHAQAGAPLLTQARRRSAGATPTSFGPGSGVAEVRVILGWSSTLRGGRKRRCANHAVPLGGGGSGGATKPPLRQQK